MVGCSPWRPVIDEETNWHPHDKYLIVLVLYRLCFSSSCSFKLHIDVRTIWGGKKLIASHDQNCSVSTLLGTINYVHHHTWSIWRYVANQIGTFCWCCCCWHVSTWRLSAHRVPSVLTVEILMFFLLLCSNPNIIHKNIWGIFVF